jgi:hypothetical protein
MRGSLLRPATSMSESAATPHNKGTTMINLTTEQEQMIRAASGTMQTVDAQAFRTHVIDRLEKLLESGIAITTKHVRSACTAELMR